MGKETTIAWTDHTFNGWWGCTKVSPGCVNCYAEAFDKRVGGDHWGPGQPRRTFGQKHWDELLEFNADAERAGVRRKVFCFSMADLMDNEAPAGHLQRLFDYVDRTPHLIYQFLTKRPENYVTRLPLLGFRHNNVWPGFTAEDQTRYDARWAAMQRLRQLRAYQNTPYWVSYEPALGPVTLRGFERKPDMVVFGGETGANRRGMDVRWAENMLAECRAFGAAFFMKQMSAWNTAKGEALIPAHLKVREFPIIGQ